MNIKTDELRKYLQAAGQIKPNPTATNLDSIKIECIGQEIIFTKTNNHIYCRYTYICQPQATETLLINEKLLTGVALTSKEYEIGINLKADGDTVVLSSGEDVIKTRNQDIKLFPIIQMATGDRIKISKEVMERIRIASKYVNNGVNVNALNFVNIGINGIFASNYSVVYHHNTFPLPEMLLDQEPLNTIKSSDDVMYWQSESYHFFQADGFMYGFIKTGISALDYRTIINQSGEDFFIAKKEDLIDFCTLVQYSKRQENPEAVLSSYNEQTLMLRFEDADFNINVSRNVIIESNAPVEPFRFNVESIALLLKTIPYELLIFTKVQGGHLIVTTEEDVDYKGIIARLQDKVNQ